MEGILVADTVGREVVYTTTCYEEDFKFTNGTQVFLQISKIPPGPEGPQGPHGEVYPAEAQDAVRIVDGVLNIVTGSLAIGMVFTPPPVNLVLGIFAGLGGLISAGLKFIPGKPDPVKEKLELLKKKIRELDTKIMARFGEMKAFITENKFSIEIIGEVATLKKFMNDVLSLLNDGSIRNFREAYHQNTPLDIAYTLMSLLAQRSTNPMAMAMEKNKDKQEETFNTWKNIIETIVGDLMFLEGIACGMLKDKDMQDCESLIEVSNEIYQSIDHWKDHYVNTAWNEFKITLPAYLKNSTHLNNAQKADNIKLQLERACPEYSFYICVMNQKKGGKDHYTKCGDPNELIELDDTGLCGAFVYRSRKGKNMANSEYEKTKKDVKYLIDPKHNYLHKTPAEFTEEALDWKKLVRTDGLIKLIDNNLNLAIRSANCPDHEWGPGWWETIMLQSKPYTLLVGLP
uniref:DUF1269 domain-containing protein n=1 Tax=Caenorhabditis tropicalis TaxID=1561998 RepID=A0A1I7TVU0_9PELO